MCTDGGPPARPGGPAPPGGAAGGAVPEDAAPGSVAEALRLADAAAGYLASPAAGRLDGAGCGEALAARSRVQAKLAAARVGLLRRFDALNGHDGDGYASPTLGEYVIGVTGLALLRLAFAGDLRGTASSGAGRHWWARLTSGDLKAHQLPDPAGQYRRPAGW